jgi:hypothetical protein
VHKSAPTVICLGSKRQKASKVDDAPVPTFLWDNRIDPELEKRTTAKCVRFIGALETTRKYTHRVWLRLVVSSFWAWIKKEKSRRNLQCLENIFYDAGQMAIFHAIKSDWWEWPGGSAPLYWQWPEYCQDIIMHGVGPRINSKPPR